MHSCYVKWKIIELEINRYKKIRESEFKWDSYEWLKSIVSFYLPGSVIDSVYRAIGTRTVNDSNLFLNSLLRYCSNFIDIYPKISTDSDSRRYSYTSLTNMSMTHYDVSFCWIIILILQIDFVHLKNHF